MFLTAHGSSRGGCAPSIGRDCFAALVHGLDDGNALWIEQLVDSKGTRILRKAKATNQGFALTGLCFPEKLHQHESSQSPGVPTTWRALPYQNVVVRSTVTKPCCDQHVLWTFVPENTQDDISMGQ